MKGTRHSSSRRRVGPRRPPAPADRGAVLIEAAFVFPILIMLVFGMVTYGISLGQGNSIENAARETSRFGATHPVTAGIKAWLDDVSGVAVASATGDLDSDAPGRYVCVALVGTDEDDGRKEISGTSVTYSSSGNCGSLTCPSTAPCVQTLLERSARLDAVVFQRTITLDGYGVSSFERES